MNEAVFWILLLIIAILVGLSLFLFLLKNKKNKEINIFRKQLCELEKLGTLGTISAGITHELKNPLNFINNFSELTVELINDLSEIIIQNETLKNTQDIVEIIKNMKDNLIKINDHGKRATSIINNILLQSRTEQSQKMPCDLNQILEEYLNLAYHGIRAQNINFNLIVEKHLDPQLPPIKVNPQSIGRVFINIIGNSLFALNEKSSQKKEFMPRLFLTTQRMAQTITVSIKDNGDGIPVDIQAKIFEPFFTTKDPQHGTGLGLSICYDIVVKEHQGQLTMNSKPGEFTEFIITLPLKTR